MKKYFGAILVAFSNSLTVEMTNIDLPMLPPSTEKTPRPDRN